MEKNRLSFRMRKLSSKELGPFRLDMASLLASSPDPFLSVEYRIDMTRCRALLHQLSAKEGIHISLTPLLNKLLATAVFQNPIFNQVVLGSSIYQLEDVVISNGYLVPGAAPGLCFVLVKNAHHMSLTDIREILEQGREQKFTSFFSPENRLKEILKRFILRQNLMRFAGEKYVFTTALRAGLASNIILQNHTYQKQASFKIIKPVINPMKVSLRIHAHCCEKQPGPDSAELRAGEILPLNVSIDHRVMLGIHAHCFGESLQKIAAAPEKYLI